MTGSEPQTPATEPQASEPTGSPRRSRWTFARVLGMILASLGGLIGLALLIGGFAVLGAYAFARDDDGYFTTDREPLTTRMFAITSDDVDLAVDAADWAPEDVLGDVRIRVESDQPVFAGIGSDADVNRYLAGVGTATLTDFDGGEPVFELHRGGAPPNPPNREGFWVAQAEGSGEQTLNWDADFGHWTALVMNADGSRGVSVEADAGIKLDWAVWAGLGLLVVGLVMSAGSVAIIVLIGRRADRERAIAR